MYVYLSKHSLFTVNTAELWSVPIMFPASQVYVPTSDDSAFIIKRVLSIIVSFKAINELLYFELLDKFIITALKYHWIYGTGTPVA